MLKATRNTKYNQASAYCQNFDSMSCFSFKVCLYRTRPRLGGIREGIV